MKKYYKLVVVVIIVILFAVAASVVKAQHAKMWTRCIPRPADVGMKCRYVDLLITAEDVRDGATFTVTTFPGYRYKLVGGSVSWIHEWRVLTGHIAGDPAGEFYILDTGQSLFIHIGASDGTWRIEQTSNGSTIYRIVRER